MEFNLKLMKFLFKIMFPLNLILFLLVAVLGYFNPWLEAKTLLKPYGDQLTLLVGYNYRSSTLNGKTTEFTSRSYALFPSVLSDFNTVRITKTNNSKPYVEINNNGFVFYIGWLIICLIGTWWFWFRSTPSKALKKGTAQLRGPLA